MNIFFSVERSIVSLKFSEGSIMWYLPTPGLQGLLEKPTVRRVAFTKVLGVLDHPAESQHPPSWLGSNREVQDENVILL